MKISDVYLRFISKSPLILLAVLPAVAQAQKTEVKCRPLVAGDFIAPNETIVGQAPNAQVCSVVVLKTIEPVDAKQEQVPTPPPSSATNLEKHERPVVFLNGTGNSQTRGGRGLFNTTWATSSQHDQSIELAKDFGGCSVSLSMKQEGADYTVILNHEGNNHNQMALLDASGQVLITDSAHGMHQSIQNKSEKFCVAILNDWNKKQKPK